MLRVHKSLLATSCFYMIFSSFPRCAMSQTQTPSRLLSETSAFPGHLPRCSDQEFFANKLGADDSVSYLHNERMNANQSCDEFLPGGPSPEFFPRDVLPSTLEPRLPRAGKLDSRPPIAKVPPAEELMDIGEQGTTIARVREAVSYILENENACSAWFRRADPQVSATFQSLEFFVDEDGPNKVIKERNDHGSWIQHGPYIAKTKQNTGPGTAITLNANGAFFRTTGEIYKLNWTGSVAGETGTWKHLEIGPYGGGSLQGQVIAVLHELGHVIGAIPWDDSSQVGYNRSQQNTELIVHYCKAEAGSSPKRLKLMMAQLGPQ